ncbi:hypothetical protein AVEN_110432-1 [Araneus ventricosus]|uniref:Uncharacterized protein n=1 Tax=Araneus ventricosus TaxID=182803 RepID=A0A4Y2KII7_ARAVE|nr:hypothetical protein AVEN_110432-1 [Araneus ventricosus]
MSIAARLCTEEVPCSNSRRFVRWLQHSGETSVNDRKVKGSGQRPQYSSYRQLKPFEFKYERKKETVDEKVENVILIELSEDEDCGSFQQEMEAAKMEEVIYLESLMVDFSTNLFVLIDNVGGARMKAHYSYICGNQEDDGGEYDMTGLRTANLAKSNLFRW